MTVNTLIGEITASKEVLSELIFILDYSADYCKSKKLLASSLRYRSASDDIYDALDEIGYYAEVDNVEV